MNLHSSDNPAGRKGTGESRDIREQLRELRDDLFPSSARGKTFFEQCIHPGFVLHILSGVFIEVNEAFRAFFGHDRDELLSGAVRAGNLIHTEDQPLLKLARRAPENIPSAEYEAYALTHAGDSIPIRMAICSRTVHDHHLLYGVIREVTDQKKREETLRQQLQEAVQANNRILTLTEKIKRVPQLTSKLMNQEPDSVQTLFQTVKSTLSKRSGMNYQAVSFLIVDKSGNQLTSPLSDDPESVALSANHPAAELIRDEDSMKRPRENTFLLPLPGADMPIGVLKIDIPPEERRLMEANPSVWNGYREILVTLSNSIGLILQSRDVMDR